MPVPPVVQRELLVVKRNQTGSQQNNAPPGPSQNNITLVVAAVFVLMFASLVLAYTFLRKLRRMNCEPKYLPGRYLKSIWRRWTLDAAPSHVLGNGSLAPAVRDGDTSYRGAGEMSEIGAAGGVRRETSIRSVITLPAYSQDPKPTEQVIAREGERGGMDVVVEFPETPEEEEARREEQMQSLYQIRLQRRQEARDREASRRAGGQAANTRGNRLLSFGFRNRQPGIDHTATDGSATPNMTTPVPAEQPTRARERRISTVSYAELGYVRHDGSRMRASSQGSENQPLLQNAAAENVEERQGSMPELQNAHSRGGSAASSVFSAPTAGLNDEVSVTHSRDSDVDPATSAVDEGDSGVRHIPPPGYEELERGDAPAYESPVAGTTERPPQLPALSLLPTIHIDLASPASTHSLTTPTGHYRRDEPSDSNYPVAQSL